jgi:hypothetical protein
VRRSQLSVAICAEIKYLDGVASLVSLSSCALPFKLEAEGDVGGSAHDMYTSQAPQQPVVGMCSDAVAHHLSHGPASVRVNWLCVASGSASNELSIRLQPDLPIFDAEVTPAHEQGPQTATVSLSNALEAHNAGPGRLPMLCQNEAVPMDVNHLPTGTTQEFVAPLEPSQYPNSFWEAVIAPTATQCHSLSIASAAAAPGCAGHAVIAAAVTFHNSGTAEALRRTSQRGHSVSCIVLWEVRHPDALPEQVQCALSEPICAILDGSKCMRHALTTVDVSVLPTGAPLAFLRTAPCACSACLTLPSTCALGWLQAGPGCQVARDHVAHGLQYL